MRQRQWQVLFKLLLLASGLGAWEWTTYTDYTYYNNVAFDGSIMWAATSGGLVKRDLAADTLQVYTTRDGLARNAIYGVILDPAGNPWLTQVPGAGGIMKFDGNSFTSYQPDQYYTGARAFDSEGKLWCINPAGSGITHSRLIVFDGTDWTVYDTLNGLPADHSVVNIFMDRSGTPVILHKWPESFLDDYPCLGLGISRPAGTGFSSHTTSRPIQVYYNEGIKALRVDTDGAVWVGAYRVLSRYRNKTWTTFTPEEGAPEQVTALLRAKDNTLWAGAADGVHSYNGTVWHRYTTPYTAITALAQDSSGTIWAGSPRKSVKQPDGTRIYIGGLLRFNGTGFDTVHTSGVSGIYDLTTDRNGGLWGSGYGGAIHVAGDTVLSYTTQNGIPSGYVFSIAADSVGDIWLGTGEGLVRLDPDTGDCFIFNLANSDILNSRVEEVAVDAQFGIWCGTPSGISVYRNASFTNYPSEETLGSAGRIEAITFGPDGSVWAGGSSGLAAYRDNNWQGIYSALDKTERSVVGNAVMDTAGMIWIATSEGLVKYDGTEWAWYDTTNGLPSAYITGVFIDAEERLWCATYDGGLCYYNGNSWTVYDTSQGLGDMRTYWISQDGNGTLWAGHYEGLSRFNGGTWETVATQPGGGLPSNMVTCIDFDDENDAWLGYEGITEFDGTTWTNEYQPLPYWKVDAVAVDHENAVWVGTEQGLVRKTGDTWTTFDSSSGLPTCSVNKLAVDSSGNVWAGMDITPYSQTPGLARFDGSTWTVYDSIMNIGIGKVYAVAQYGRTQYFGIDIKTPLQMSSYKAAIISYDGSQWSMIDSTQYSRQPLTIDKTGNLWVAATGYYTGSVWHASNKPDNFYNATSGACDQNGILWFGTGNGIIAYDGTDWVNYSTADGLTDYDVRAVGVDKQNRKWFCTAGGVSVLQADSLGIADFLQPKDIDSDLQLTVTPNPFTGSTVIHLTGSAPKADVTIMDRTGRQVASFPGYTAEFRWDGRNAAGQNTPAGIYYLSVKNAGHETIRKLIKIR